MVNTEKLGPSLIPHLRGIDHHLQQKPRGLVSHPREKESLYWEAQMDLGEYISKTAGLSDQ